MKRNSLKNAIVKTFKVDVEIEYEDGISHKKVDEIAKDLLLSSSRGGSIDCILYSVKPIKVTKTD